MGGHNDDRNEVLGARDRQGGNIRRFCRELKKPLSSKCAGAVIAIQAQQMMPIA